jgi:hypothetical protein
MCTKKLLDGAPNCGSNGRATGPRDRTHPEMVEAVEKLTQKGLYLSGDGSVYIVSLNFPTNTESYQSWT